MVETAPGVVLGFFDQTACDGIAVDVAELLDPFWVSEDVEVVVAELPELGSGASE